MLCERKEHQLRWAPAVADREFAAPAQPETWSPRPETEEIPAPALLAQLVEHFHGKEGVVGSSPTEGFSLQTGTFRGGLPAGFWRRDPFFVRTFVAACVRARIAEIPGNAKDLISERRGPARLSYWTRNGRGQEGVDGAGAATLIGAMVDENGDGYVTVAEAAAAFDVSPQAVLKWIDRGAMTAEILKDGSCRIPAAALETNQRFDRARARRLQASLAQRHDADVPVSNDELLDQIGARRR
jgi:hypothetical protein